MSRVTFNQVNTVVQRQLNRNQLKLADLQERLSSGKALARPSDNPIAVVNDMDLRSELNYRSQSSRNIDNGNTYLTVLDSTLMGFDDSFQRVRELALQGSNDTLLPRDRQYVNNEVRQELLQMVNMANTTYKGDFLFSGTDTDKVPYSVASGTMSINGTANEVPVGGGVPETTDPLFAVNTPIQLYDRNLTDSTATLSPYGNPETKRIIPGTFEITGLTEGTDFSVDYINGTVTFLNAAVDPAISGTQLDISFDWVRRNELLNSNGNIEREVEPGNAISINAKADKVFGKETEMDTFSAVISLMQGLHTSTQSEIETSITNIDVASQRLLGQQATVGAWANRVEATGDRNDQTIINATKLQSSLEDLDFAKAISDYTLMNTVYQASLQSASSVLSKSLLDYL